jgi:hypothetical protein
MITIRLFLCLLLEIYLTACGVETLVYVPDPGTGENCADLRTLGFLELDETIYEDGSTIGLQQDISFDCSEGYYPDIVYSFDIVEDGIIDIQVSGNGWSPSMALSDGLCEGQWILATNCLDPWIRVRLQKADYFLWIDGSDETMDDHLGEFSVRIALSADD